MAKNVEPKQDYCERIYSWQLDQVPTDNPVHDKLINAFQQYYKANLQWIQCGSKRSALDARYWLNEINKLTVEQRRIINNWRKFISDKSNKDRTYKSTTKKYRKFLQIHGKANIQDDNQLNE